LKNTLENSPFDMEVFVGPKAFHSSFDDD